MRSLHVSQCVGGSVGHGHVTMALQEVRVDRSRRNRVEFRSPAMTFHLLGKREQKDKVFVFLIIIIIVCGGRGDLNFFNSSFSLYLVI